MEARIRLLGSKMLKILGTFTLDGIAEKHFVPDNTINNFGLNYRRVSYFHKSTL